MYGLGAGATGSTITTCSTTTSGGASSITSRLGVCIILGGDRVRGGGGEATVLGHIDGGMAELDVAGDALPAAVMRSLKPSGEGDHPRGIVT